MTDEQGSVWPDGAIRAVARSRNATHRRSLVPATPNATQARAIAVLDEAVRRALSDEELPGVWLEATDQVGRHVTRSNIAMLGIALLAKAADSGLDAFGLKARAEGTPAPFRPYDARQIAAVLVDYGVPRGLHLGVGGREPLNGQPWWRPARVTRDMVVRRGREREHGDLCDILETVQSLTSEAATSALAAFVRVRLGEGQRLRAVVVLGSGLLPFDQLVTAAGSLIAGTDGPACAQGFGAACLDLIFERVEMSRLNDPSRNAPGDVQAVGADNEILVAVEVRDKVMTAPDVLIYAQTVGARNVSRAVVFALRPEQPELDRESLSDAALETFGVHLTVLIGVAQVLRAAITWSGLSTAACLELLPELVLTRITEMEVQPATREAWAAHFKAADDQTISSSSGSDLSNP